MRLGIERLLLEGNKPILDKSLHSTQSSVNIIYWLIQRPRIGRAKDAKTAIRQISIDTAQ